MPSDLFTGITDVGRLANLSEEVREGGRQIGLVFEKVLAVSLSIFWVSWTVNSIQLGSTSQLVQEKVAKGFKLGFFSRVSPREYVR